MLIPAGALLALGVLFVYSASFAVAEHRYGNPYHFVLRQGVWILLGILLFALVQRIPMEIWRRRAPLLFLFSLILLLLLYLPGLGSSSHGAHRWLRLGGVSLQPSEIIKPTLILYLAKILTVGHDRGIPSLAVLTGAAFVIGVVALVILFQPDYGGAMILFFLLFVSYFLVGVSPFLLLLVALPVVGIAIIFIRAEPYRMDRWIAFLDPWNPSLASNEAYQLRQSFLAFGNGGLWGEGLLRGKQKLFYLPEAHTDFIFAVIGEELGFWGCMIVIALFSWLLLELGRIAFNQRDFFLKLVAMDMLVLFYTEVLINFGVVTGLLPPKGIALPLLSYGGSSLLAHIWMLGLFYRMCKKVP